MPSWGTKTASPGGLSPYWPAAYPGPRFPANWTEGLFSPISPSPLKIKLQFTVQAEELTPTTPSDKGALVFADTTAESAIQTVIE